MRPTKEWYMAECVRLRGIIEDKNEKIFQLEKENKLLQRWSTVNEDVFMSMSRAIDANAHMLIDLRELIKLGKG